MISTGNIRKIIHIDMDAFFAAVEQRDFPVYRGKPVIVGGLPEKRGVVAACSYEARKFGIHSAMPSARAYRLCPDVIFLRPRFDVYREVSNEIRQIFKRFTGKIEPMSLDEAYLDVTKCPAFQGSATKIAEAIRKQIKKELALTASAGVSYNKFLAKIASDMNKPDGLFVIRPEQGPAFIERLPIGKFHGIGKATEAKMKALNIHTGADLKQHSLEYLKANFGKAGNYYYHIARGIDDRPVNPVRIRKSIGSETTFEYDLSDKGEMLKRLYYLAEKVIENLRNREYYAKTITLKVKYDDFKQITRSLTLEEPFNDISLVKPVLSLLLDKTEAGQRKVRLLGITTSNFSREEKTRGTKQIILL